MYGEGQKTKNDEAPRDSGDGMRYEVLKKKNDQLNEAKRGDARRIYCW